MFWRHVRCQKTAHVRGHRAPTSDQTTAHWYWGNSTLGTLSLLRCLGSQWILCLCRLQSPHLFRCDASDDHKWTCLECVCVNPAPLFFFILIYNPACLVLIHLILVHVRIGPQWPPLLVLICLVARTLLLFLLIQLLCLSLILIRLLRFFCVVVWGRFRRSLSRNTR